MLPTASPTFCKTSNFRAWDGLLAGIDSGRYDIMVNGVDITEERAEKYSFSDPYAYNRTAVIVNSANDEIQSMEDLDGKSTANTISSTYAEVAEKYGATVTGVDDLEQTFELLLSGRIDATLNAEVTYYDYMIFHYYLPYLEVFFALRLSRAFFKSYHRQPAMHTEE